MSDKLDPHTLRGVRDEMHRWREANDREGVWTAGQMLGHVIEWLDAKRTEAEAPPETDHAQRWEPRTLGERLSYEQGHKDARKQVASVKEARAQVWAEAIRVVEQMLPVAAWTFNMARVAILATLRAQSKRS